MKNKKQKRLQKRTKDFKQIVINRKCILCERQLMTGEYVFCKYCYNEHDPDQADEELNKIIK